MKRTMKRLLALILTMAICSGLLSANVWAMDMESQEYTLAHTAKKGESIEPETVPKEFTEEDQQKMVEDNSKEEFQDRKSDNTIPDAPELFSNEDDIDTGSRNKELNNENETNSLISPQAVRYCSGGIKGNGTNGITIDINSAPYTTFGTKKRDGDATEWAYGNQGCAWFASARVNQLTGKGNTIWGGTNWYNNEYSSYGFSRGLNPKAKALACFSGHVAVVEAVSGNTLTISEGGMDGLSDYDHGYCIIRQVTRQYLEAGYGTGSFLGYVYLNGSVPDPTPQMGISGTSIPSTITKGNNVTLSGNITANGTITWVWIGVRPKGEYDTIISCEANPLATSYNISSIAKQLKFNTLESGEYTLYIEGITGDKYFTVYKKDFTVSVPPTKPSVSIDRKSSVTGESVTISWNKTQNAKSYIVDGWLNDKEIIWNNVGDKTSFSYTPTVEGVHSFFVIAVNGDLTATSDGVSCTVEKSVTPQAPVLKAAKESVSIGETITLSWNKTQNARSYIIDGWLNGKEIVWKSVGDKTSFSYTPNVEGTHSFFVIAVNGNKKSTSKGVSVTVSENNPEPAVHTHTWDNGRITKQPTYTNEGIKTYTCTVCHQARAEAIPKLPKKENVITVGNFVKSYSAKAQSFNLNAKINSKAKLSYKSSNKKVKVKNGKVTIPAKFSGTAKITITAAATDEYSETRKTITVTVPTVSNVTKATAGKGQMTVQWKKNTTGKGYEIQVALKKDFKKVAKKVKINKNATVKTAIKDLKKGTYYVRIRTINGKSYSNWSRAKTVKVK